jgi:putative addiction module component (TIGR02574 family)
MIEANASWIASNICLFARSTGTVARRYNEWMNASLFDQVRQLSVEEQLEFVEALWDGIVDQNAVPGPTNAQKAELDRRLADHAANPDNVVTWDEVRDFLRDNALNDATFANHLRWRLTGLMVIASNRDT